MRPQVAQAPPPILPLACGVATTALQGCLLVACSTEGCQMLQMTATTTACRGPTTPRVLPQGMATMAKCQIHQILLDHTKECMEMARIR